jgi:uncharacterized protein (DUF2164 family)
MPSSFSKEQKLEIISSLRRYFTENLDSDLSEMQAGFLLEYFMNEIAPFAYNQGVEDAQRYFATITEDLPGTCFQEALTYWKTQKGTSRAVRRKPDI